METFKRIIMFVIAFILFAGAAFAIAFSIIQEPGFDAPKPLFWIGG